MLKKPRGVTPEALKQPLFYINIAIEDSAPDTFKLEASIAF